MRLEIKGKRYVLTMTSAQMAAMEAALDSCIDACQQAGTHKYDDVKRFADSLAKASSKMKFIYPKKARVK